MLMGDVPKKVVSLDKDAPSAICSCTQCESIFCFGKRHITKTTCSCEYCKSKSCAGNKIKDFQSDEIVAVYLNAAKSKRESPSRKAEELTEDEINYELDRNNIITTNQPPPKTLDEYIDRLYIKTPSERFGPKPESLNEYIDMITGKNTSALQSYIKDLKEKSSLGRLRTKKLRKCKCCKSIYSLKSNMICQEQSDVQIVKRKECETEVRNVMLSGPSIDFNPANNLIKSQDNTTDKSHSNSIFSANNSIFNYDIFAKIKEAYNACSCIVCECIPTMQSQKDVCSCKPCECSDCKSFMKSNKIQKQHGLKYTPSQYISRCLTWKPQPDCACKPCDCALCKKTGAGKACDCDQCQCDECKPTIQAGAPHGDRKENTPCQCAPCECTECVRGYINVSKNSLSKASLDKKVCRTCHCEICPNDVCAVGVESCNCEKVLKKNNIYQPENKEILDFDMQTALILNDIYHHKDSVKRSQDMVAMYSALPRIYNNYASNSINTNKCTCDVCECLTCVCKEDTINAIKSSQLFSCRERHSMHSQKTASLIKNSATKICECTPCECQICNYRKLGESFHLTNKKSIKSPKALCSCKCAACFCSNTVPESNKQYARRCKCTTCRCERCFGDECASAKLVLNRMPMKRGEVLSPVAHQEKIQKRMLVKGSLLGTNLKSKQILSNKNFNASLKSEQKVNGYSREPNIIRSIDLVKAKPPITYRTFAKMRRNTAEIGTGLLQSLNKNDIFKYDAYVQCRDWSKGNSVNEINLIEKISESYVSIYPSTDSVSKTSIHKENDTATSILVDKNKSLESSCNSSGHDQPRYLIRFPKSTAETCLEDVMKGHLGNGIKLNTFNTSVKRHKDWASKKKDKSSNCNIIKSATSFSTTIHTNGSGNSVKYENRSNNGTTFYYEPKINSFSKKTTKHLNIKYDIEDCNTGLNRHRITQHAYESNQSRKNIIQSTPNLNTERHSNRIQDQVQRSGKVFACYNLSDEKITEFGKNKDSKTKLNESLHKLLNFNIDSLNINVEEDYKRVKKTIKDANEFSRKLLQLLETYEKANREFKRISDMLQISNAALVNTTEFTKQELFDVESDKFEHISKATRDEGITTPWSFTTETHLLPNDATAKGNNHKVISHKYSLSDTPEKMNANYRNVTKVHGTTEALKENQTSSILDERPCKDNENKQTVKTNKRRDLDLVMEILDPILGNAKNNHVPSSVYQSHNPSLNELQLQTEELSVVTIPPSQIFVIDNECQYYQSETAEFSLKAKLEFQKPQKVDKLVGEQLLLKDVGVSCSDVESMEDLEDTVKELLTQFVLQPLEKEEKLIPEKIKDKNSYFRSDSLSSLKVNFLLVRKVSDHTVLVKWSQPWDLSCVQGYELLVDGRAVQKIFNPSKCIAVVTCLPHTDKILLTIRTVTTFVPRTGHLPATTIIYRPRSRKQ